METEIEKMIFIQNGQVLTSSLQVAEYFEREHKNVLQTIEQILDDIHAGEIIVPKYLEGRLTFQPTTIVVRGKEQPVYLMTKSAFTFLVGKFKGTKADNWKLEYISVFEQMEDIIEAQKLNTVSKYVLPERTKWEKRFPENFYREIYRLNKWDWAHYEKNKTHYSVMGTWTDKYIWKTFPKEVQERIKQLNYRLDSGTLEFKNHQFLTQPGIDELEAKILQVVAVMETCQTWKEFESRMFPKLNPGQPRQLQWLTLV